MRSTSYNDLLRVSRAHVSPTLNAEPSFIEPILETPESLQLVQQLSEFTGVDSSVAASMLEVADGDVDKATDLLLEARAREDARAETEQQQEAREAEIEVAARSSENSGNR
jgi:translation elongation factor EF-Ts